MTMHNPPHPGEILKELYLTPLKLTVTETAHGLQVTRKALSELLNEKTGISTEMAIRLSRAFSTSPESWLNLQHQYDLWHARLNTKISRVKIFSSKKRVHTALVPA